MTSYYLKSKPYQGQVILFRACLLTNDILMSVFAECFECFQWNQGAAKAELKRAKIELKPGTHLVGILTIFKLRLLDFSPLLQGTSVKSASTYQGQINILFVLSYIFNCSLVFPIILCLC